MARAPVKLRYEANQQEKLMNHSTGISDSYLRATESEFLEDYLKAVDFLTIIDSKTSYTSI